MDNTPLEHAKARLTRLSDLGFSVVSISQNSKPQVLASTHSPTWTDQSVSDLLSQEDPLANWLATSVGKTQSNEIENSAALNAVTQSGSTTMLSELYLGVRLCSVLSHSKTLLEEFEVKDARAAALILYDANATSPEFAITAKELVYLQQVAAGATDDEIAQDLQLSLRAVKERKRKAIEDLNASNISHAIGIAKRNDLI